MDTLVSPLTEVRSYLAARLDADVYAGGRVGAAAYQRPYHGVVVGLTGGGEQSPGARGWMALGRVGVELTCYDEDPVDAERLWLQCDSEMKKITSSSTAGLYTAVIAGGPFGPQVNPVTHEYYMSARYTLDYEKGD